MTFSLDLRVKRQGPHTTLIDGLCFRCGWCTARFGTAAELIKHVCAKRRGEHE